MLGYFPDLQPVSAQLCQVIGEIISTQLLCTASVTAPNGGAGLFCFLIPSVPGATSIAFACIDHDSWAPAIGRMPTAGAFLVKAG